jgi:hypothetical protein
MTEILDMSQFTEAKSDQLNADDLIGSPRTVTITKVVGTGGDQPVSIHYQGDNGKPFKPCKTIRRVLIGVWGKYANEYIGKSMTLYRDDRVTFGGLETGGIRISHMSGIDKETVVVVMKTKGKKAGIKILPLKVEQKEDGQRKWADGFVASCKSAPDSEQLEQYIGKQAKWLKILENERPELHVECDHAISTAREGFKVDHQEGRTDSQHGDQFDGSEQGE